ncbi:trimethylamine methyltransferase family protein [Geminicoccus roseus]|uniref:trimethylamine methyltransferase family protein n=1 Tax=Geminicoccus roseus TaxID=404900 RepID=UPI000687B7F5|nr:trimethylamine methyltransferase family protein [Geminicoccus roseus]
MAMVLEQDGRRRGGREARRELRAREVSEDARVVRPGIMGGRFLPLDPRDVLRVHEAALTALATIGFGQPPASTVAALTAAGAEYRDARIFFPRALVEDTVASAARNFTLFGRDRRHDLHPSAHRVHFGTAGAAVHMIDARTGEYRESTLCDLYDIARLVDRLDNVHFYQRSVVPRDIPDPFEMDINTAYACLAGTAKHVGTSFVKGEHLQAALPMFHAIAGSEAAWRAQPFVSLSCCFVVPPMRFADDACSALETAVYAGMPVLLLSAGQAGATAPAALAGALVQTVAECLAGLVYVNALKPGAPALFGPWPFVSDLRTGAMSGGSGEQALLTAACAQMGRFYDLPTGSAAGMTDSKIPDSQAGFEKAYTNVLAGQAGLNLVYESVGMHASLLGSCLESYVIDDDMLGSILRTIKGIEITEATLSLEAMREVCLEGPGHYLGHQQTLDLMQTEYLYPTVSDRTSPKEWKEQGSTDSVARAGTKLRRILSKHYPTHIPPEVDSAIRVMLPIRLDPAQMHPGDGRW